MDEREAHRALDVERAAHSTQIAWHHGHARPWQGHARRQVTSMLSCRATNELSVPRISGEQPSLLISEKQTFFEGPETVHARNAIWNLDLKQKQMLHRLQTISDADRAVGCSATNKPSVPRISEEPLSLLISEEPPSTEDAAETAAVRVASLRSPLLTEAVRCSNTNEPSVPRISEERASSLISEERPSLEGPATVDEVAAQPAGFVHRQAPELPRLSPFAQAPAPASSPSGELSMHQQAEHKLQAPLY